VPNPWCSIHGRYKQQRGLAPSPGPGVQEEGDGLSTSQVIAERGGGRRSVELAEAQSGGSVLPWLATPSRGQASGRMYDVRASRNAPALRPPASPSVLWTRGVRCSRTGSRPELRPGVDGISNTVRPGPFRPLDQTRTVEIGRVSSRRSRSSLSVVRAAGPCGSWMACRHGAGGRTPRPARWSTPAGSPVEDAANFDSPPLPSRTAPSRRRELWSVQASVHGAGRPTARTSLPPSAWAFYCSSSIAAQE
jgi:hypothetical protein